MDERTSPLISELFEERQRLGDNLAALERKVRESTTWRGYFVRKPWTMLALALGGGILLSSLIISKSR